LGGDREVVHRIRVFAWVGSKGEAAYFFAGGSLLGIQPVFFIWFAEFFFSLRQPVSKVVSEFYFLMIYAHYIIISYFFFLSSNMIFSSIEQIVKEHKLWTKVFLLIRCKE
jgi:hypothetical protein